MHTHWGYEKSCVLFKKISYRSQAKRKPRTILGQESEEEAEGNASGPSPVGTPTQPAAPLDCSVGTSAPRPLQTGAGWGALWRNRTHLWMS